MKFKKTKTSLIAFAQTEEDIKGTAMKIGDSIGSMNLKTGKFVGATACMLKLQEEFDKINDKKENIMKAKNASLELISTTTYKAGIVEINDKEVEFTLIEMNDENNGSTTSEIVIVSGTEGMDEAEVITAIKKELGI